MKLPVILQLSLAICSSQALSVPFKDKLPSLQSIFTTAQERSIITPIDLSQYNFSAKTDISESTVSELFSLHKALVSIPSVSYHEKEISFKLAGYLRSKGLTVELQEVDKDRYNVIAYKGSKNDTKVLVTSHIDTVPPYFPYSLSEDGSRIYGRGSTDAKGSVASQIIAFLELVDELEEGQVSLLFDVGEEYGGDGFHFADANLDYHWDSVIFGEPTELKLGVGHKGVYGGEITVEGKASHSGYPELGIDANKILIEFLYKLNQKVLPTDDLLGPSSLNVGLISGGVASNVISAHASASLAFRVSSSLETFDQLIQDTIDETAGGEHIKLPSAQIKLSPVFFDYKVDGFESILLGYGTDAFSLKKRHVEHKFLYGPGSIHVAHGAGEFVDTDDLIQAVEGYKKLIKHALSL